MLVLRTSNFQEAAIRPIVPRHKHSIALIVHLLIIYMKKFLDSDWLRTVQFFLNTVQKRGN